ncbi:MAG TPA: hypothetical protein P5277_01970 [Candidatus Paceibacterota bacterium]|nr:hypothetical protein [Candidatus Paceibacterota bacterium]
MPKKEMLNKAIVFDAGIMITFSMNCILDILRDLKKSFNGKFIITRNVEEECVKRPLTIKKYKLGALKIKELVDANILEFPESLGISIKDIETETLEVLRESNSIFRTDHRSIHIIDEGEASVLALNYLLKKKGIDSVIAIDERTMRMLCENPSNLQKLFEEKFDTKVIMNKINSPFFKDVKVIRSSELIFVAYKKGLIKDKEILDAMLYGAKFKGSSISFDEIKELESLV